MMAQVKTQGLTVSCNLFSNSSIAQNNPGYRIGRIQVIFSFPHSSIPILSDNGIEVPQYLAYVEWYSCFSENPDPNHFLYKLTPLKDCEGRSICSIISVMNIKRMYICYRNLVWQHQQSGQTVSFLISVMNFISISLLIVTCIG